MVTPRTPRTPRPAHPPCCSAYGTERRPTPSRMLTLFAMACAVVELPLGRSTSTRAPEPNSWLDGDGTDFAGVDVRVVRESEMARRT